MEEIQMERWQLAVERIRQIAEDPEVDGGAGDYFKRTAEFVLLMLEALEKAENGWMETASLEELQAWNDRLYGDIAGKAYESSYANPAWAVSRLPDACGQILSFVYTELRGMIVYACERRTEEMLICMELFLQIHSEFTGGEVPSREQLASDVYWFISDYSDVMVAGRVREQLDPSLSFARDIIMEADLMDPRYLYRFGEYISGTEIGTSRYLAGLSGEEIDRIAGVFTEGYRRGFEAAGKPLHRKKTVNIRYGLGFERIIRQAVKQFEAMGLESIIYRAAVSRVNMRENARIGYCGSSPNKQYDYDHRGDAALFMDRAFAERRIGVLKTAYERYREPARTHGGPAVLEIFGETPFVPETKPEALKLDEKQQEIQVSLNNRTGQLVNTYIPGEERSFTIMAFPVPDIGPRFEEIFRETMKLNTLDSRTWQQIQQNLINVLDTGVSVHILGKGDNRTDLKVMLAGIRDPLLSVILAGIFRDHAVPEGKA